MGVSGITSRVITSESQREREMEREGKLKRERERDEPVSGFGSQAIFSEWMRMPNMSHRVSTLNNEQETSRKSFSFWRSVIARGPRRYRRAAVGETYAVFAARIHTYPNITEREGGEKIIIIKKSIRQATPHMCRRSEAETCVVRRAAFTHTAAGADLRPAFNLLYCSDLCSP